MPHKPDNNQEDNLASTKVVEMLRFLDQYWTYFEEDLSGASITHFHTPNNFQQKITDIMKSVEATMIKH